MSQFVRLKFLLRAPLQYGLSEAADVFDPEWPRYVRITDIDSSGQLRPETISSVPTDLARDYLLAPGDLLFARSGATVGKTALCEQSWGVAAFAGYLIRARPDLRRIDPRFLFYFTNSERYWRWLNGESVQATIQNVGADKFANLLVPVPSLGEQRRIVGFLEAAGRELDELIAKKQRLIDLLEEKRAALISRAVTRGLDPGVPMKDSGVEWLGHVPAHWCVRRVKQTLRSIEQGWSPQCDNSIASDDQWGVLKAGCVNGWDFDESENKALPNDLEPDPDLEIRPGDVLVSRANTRSLLGSAVCVHEVRPKLLLCDKLYRLRTDQATDPEYLAIVLRMPFVRAQIEPQATGTSSSMLNIGQDTIRNLWIPMPPAPEQQEILSWIGTQVRQFADCGRLLKETVERLREYRSALITAAVTGQLDLRKHEKQMEALA